MKPTLILCALLIFLVGALWLKMRFFTQGQSHYNYGSYLGRKGVSKHLPLPKLNASFPDAKLIDSSERPVLLSSLWVEKPLVVETGSMTCPIALGHGVSMEQVVSSFGERVNFAVLYTREAHPGMFNSCHDSMDEKIERSKTMQQRVGDRRVLVDALDGALHRQLGNFPNSVFIIDRNGVTAHSSYWNDPLEVQKTLKSLLETEGVVTASTRTFEDQHRMPRFASKWGMMKSILAIIPGGGPDAFVDFVANIIASIGREIAAKQGVQTARNDTEKQTL